MTEPRKPDEIMADFEAGLTGQADIDVMAVVWEMFEDIFDSIELASKCCINRDEIMPTVRDYVVNNYGES